MVLESVNDFKLASWRLYIPRKGYYSVDFPSMPHAKHQLSVSPQPNLPVLNINELPLSGPVDTPSVEYLRQIWSFLFKSRLNQEKPYLKIYDQTPIQSPFFFEQSTFYPERLGMQFFAPTTEKLFKAAIEPAIKKYCLQNGKHLAVDYVSYLFPFWSQEELKPVQIYEGELSRLIQEGGTLPDNIGTVYIDFPPNQQLRKNSYTKNQLIEFIKRHKKVLFIIDQANLYFDTVGLNINDDLIFESLSSQTEKISDDDLVVVTNTTTKSLGKSGCAFAAVTKQAKELIASVPPLIAFDKDSYRIALQSLFLEIPRSLINIASYHNDRLPHSLEFRQTIAQNRKKLIQLLTELFGEAAISPELLVGGARIIINAQAIKNIDGLGFKNAGELCKYLYHKFSIATKPATVYVSREKWSDDQFGKYVHITIPWTNEMMDAVINAFEELRNRKNND